jgi:hypothetical protein
MSEWIIVNFWIVLVNFWRVVLVTSVLLTGLPYPVLSQYSDGEGIESVKSNSIRNISINQIVYQGECPGIVQYSEKAYFVSDKQSPKPGYRVKLTNMSRGLSPDAPPFTDRSYAKGRASESFEIALGAKHQGRYFIVRQGENLLQYEITRDGNLVGSGTFTYNVIVTSSTEYRNKVAKEVRKYNSDGSSYLTTEYRCP